MCVSGMLPARQDHARAALRLALDLHAAAAAVDVGGGGGGAPSGVQIRVAVHSGAVTSGVIGHLRARFALFGDTVTTASALEASGCAGAVQLSEATFAACGLPPGAIPERRVNVKGKGQLNSASAALHGAHASMRTETYACVCALAVCSHAHAAFLLDAASSEATRVRALLGAASLPPMVDDTLAVDDAISNAALQRGGRRSSVASTLFSRPSLAGYNMSARSSSVSRTSVVLDASAMAVPTPTIAASEGTVRGATTFVEAAESAARLRDGIMTHFMTQICSSCAPTFVYIALSPRGWVYTLLVRSYIFLFIAMMAAFVMRARFSPALQSLLSAAWPHAAVHMRTTSVWVLELALMFDFMQAPGGGGAADSPTARVREFFLLLHAPLVSMPWITSQLPMSVIFFPEVVRNVLYVGCALWIAFTAQELTPGIAAAIVTEGALCAAMTPVVLLLYYRAQDNVVELLADVETCPLVLRRCRDACRTAGLALRSHYFNNQVLVEMHSAILMSLFGSALILRMFCMAPAMSLRDAALAMAQLHALLLLSSCAAKLQPSVGKLDALAAEVNAVEQAKLRARLAAAHSEADILRAGCDALLSLFPAVTACALGAFAEGSGCDVVSTLQCRADEEASREALAASLPADVGALGDVIAVSSVAWACQESFGRLAALDSRTLPGGVDACVDWAAAIRAGLPSVRAITTPLSAGHVTMVRTSFPLPCVPASVRVVTLDTLLATPSTGLYAAAFWNVHRPTHH
jgi:hypothetical protein